MIEVHYLFEDFLFGKNIMGRRKNYEFIYDHFGYDYDTVVVYIDGACFNNGYPDAAAGLGVWFNYGHAL